MDEDRAQQLKDGVRRAYSAAAEKPQDEHPFPVGRHFAASIGYSDELLDNLPASAVDAFSGVSNLAVLADISVNDVVLDLGCGAGLDSLIAARRVGPNGKVIGVDFSASMLARARVATVEDGAAHVELCRADAEWLPVGTGKIDVGMVNGIFNLNPSRTAIFSELARVVRQGGAVYAAELILTEALPLETCTSEIDWFA
jgi:SAM-dependent methyltransferase